MQLLIQLSMFAQGYWGLHLLSAGSAQLLQRSRRAAADALLRRQHGSNAAPTFRLWPLIR